MNLKKGSSFMVMLGAAWLIASSTVYAQVLPDEAAEMEQKFSQEVGPMLIESGYQKLLIERAAVLFSDRLGGPPAVPQYFLLVDRQPDAQIVSLAFLNKEGQITILGASKTSTGNPTRAGFYETPVGVFKNMPNNMNYRALGTKNSKGWRGLGTKGSRVWDLGWQESRHPKGGMINIRLLVHATDPDAGEPRLGRRDSKGCIRIPATLNRFLDYHGILDAEYERSEKGKRIFLKNREPATLAGSLVVVVDSAS